MLPTVICASRFDFKSSMVYTTSPSILSERVTFSMTFGEKSDPPCRRPNQTLSQIKKPRNHRRKPKHDTRKNDSEHNTCGKGPPPSQELIPCIHERKTRPVDKEYRRVHVFAGARLARIIKDAPRYTWGVFEHVVPLVKCDEGPKDNGTTYTLPERGLRRSDVGRRFGLNHVQNRHLLSRFSLLPSP